MFATNGVFTQEYVFRTYNPRIVPLFSIAIEATATAVEIFPIIGPLSVGRTEFFRMQGYVFSQRQS